jgi:hypothetical protein
MASTAGDSAHIVSHPSGGSKWAVSMTKRSVEGPTATGQLDRFQTPWRSLGIGAGAVGAPAAISYLHPAFGWILVGSEVATFMIVLAAALFGTSTISERAFRLLRWLANRPEPAAPSSPESSTASGAGQDGPAAS